jgi:hypothetical protein
MRFISVILLLIASTVEAQQLKVVKLRDNQYVAFEIDASGGYKYLGIYTSVKGIGDIPTPPPVVGDEPTGPGQLICVRPWSCTLDESDADLTIRESIDAAKSTIPYLRLLPGTSDQDLQPHPAERYRGMVADQTRAWVFHVVPTKKTPRILHQGPLNADIALGWIKVPKLALAAAEQANEAQWLDVDFSQQPQDSLGALSLPPLYAAQAIAAAQNVKTLPGFKPIPKAEWTAWTARFPVARMARSIRNVTEQTMGSCVGHAIANSVEAGEYMMAGDLFFRRISGMSMYKRIGRSPSSGAYIPDAYDEISRGILPVTGQGYPHEFAQDTGWSTPLPSGWESTARFWKAAVVSIDDEESAFRWLMDCRLRTQFGRSSHSISGFAFTESGKWAYENSWGAKKFGDFGKCVGYDSRFYDSFGAHPVLRDEVPVLLARELPAMRDGPPSMRDAASEFHDKIQDIKRAAEAASKKE